jgi:hypothetical protein
MSILTVDERAALEAFQQLARTHKAQTGLGDYFLPGGWAGEQLAKILLRDTGDVGLGHQEWEALGRLAIQISLECPIIWSPSGNTGYVRRQLINQVRELLEARGIDWVTIAARTRRATP